MSIQAYQRTVTQSESPRELEYRALGQATAGLLRAKDEGAANLGLLAEALDQNRRFWNMLSADCALEGNQLPGPLRASIISLALFVARYSTSVLRDGAEIDPLIDINKSVMEGLAPQGV